MLQLILISSGIDPLLPPGSWASESAPDYFPQSVKQKVTCAKKKKSILYISILSHNVAVKRNNCF
jgi:hypothetical protein